MASIPVRLSAQLASRARQEAELQDRSLTEQVEHWARLGQAVEAVISAGTVARLKARSHDPSLDARLAVARSAEGRAKAAALIAARHPSLARAAAPASPPAIAKTARARPASRSKR